MQSGKMDHRITIQSNTYTVDDYGGVIYAWSDRATVAAQVIKRGTSEFIASYGIADKGIIIFRVRWLDGVNKHRPGAVRGQGNADQGSRLSRAQGGP